MIKISLNNLLGDIYISSKDRRNKQIFNNQIELAKGIIERYKKQDVKSHDGEHPLIAYINLLGKKTQTNALLGVIGSGETYRAHHFTWVNYYEFMNHKIWVEEVKGREYPLSLLEHTEELVNINLKSNFIIPTIWKNNSVIDCLSDIYIWEESKTNHKVEIWQPMGICWVNGGNHSIATGILKGIGTMEAKVVNTDKLHKHIWTDGLFYYNKINGERICKVRNIEFSAIFEIGRIMREEGIRFRGVLQDSE